MGAQMCDPQREGSCGPSATCYAGACFDDTYTLTGCRVESHCGVYTRVCANCASGDNCPGGDNAYGNTDPTLCDSAPVFQKGGPDGPVLYRLNGGGYVRWVVGPSERLNDCSRGRPYLYSADNPGNLGDAPTAPGYSAGDGWTDPDAQSGRNRGTIAVNVGGGTGGGGGGQKG
jgi:hypothetical protein